MNYRLNILLLLLMGVLLQTGCGTNAAYTGESFSSDSPFKLRVDSDIDAACESARRSLLGQGYLIDLASSGEVKGRKAATVEGKQNAFIEMNVVCVPERGGSTIFATGVLSTYDLKKNSSSASVGLSALGSISLPIGQSVDSLVKVSEQTIDDKEYYKRFFTAVETILGEMLIREADDDPATEPAEESAAQKAGQPVDQPRIWPELFPQRDGSAVAPEPSSEQLAPETVPEPAPAAAPEPAPQPNPQQGVPETTPAPLPANAEPVMAAEVIQQQAVPGTVTEPLPLAEPASIAPAPAPNEEPHDIAPAPAVSEAALEVPPAPVVREATLGIEPTVSSASTTSMVAVPQLAPIQVTALRKSMSKPATVEQAAPEGEPQESASQVNSLF